jgi:antitoxin CptB
MSGTTRSSAGLDARRRQILYRSWHRGMREMDLIMGRFADAEIGELSEEDLSEFERLIEVTDRDLLGWITGEIETPSNYDTRLFRRLKAFHTHTSPLHT